MRMPKRSKSIIKSQFQTRRTRLLYFIYKSRGGKIKNDLGIKSRLRRAFKYKSDGHLYHDLKYLMDNGLLEEMNGYYKVTKAGREEFRLLSTLQLAIFLSLFLGLYVIILGLAEMLTSAVLVGANFLIYMGVIMLAFGVIYWFSLRVFSPHPPDIKDELAN